MAIGVLNNIPSLTAENQLNITNASLQKTLFQLSSGSRINSGADDAAGLAIANGLQANIAALSQSVSNSNNGVGSLQVADGALGQVTNLLDRAITLGTEAATGTVSSQQRGALDAEYQSIKAEIDSIGTNTTFNGTAVFSAATTSIFLSDSSTAGTSTISVATGTLSAAGLGLTGDLTTAATAQTELTSINTAIGTVA
ncbi:MAG: flagellin, partial [Candidatus Acidiferrales bacterium]